MVLAWQLLLPGFVGLANNGDFPKVIGPLCFTAEDHGADNFLYFQPGYVRSSDGCWSPGVPSSENALAYLSWNLAGRPERFDIRWTGALHIFLFAFSFFFLFAFSFFFVVRSVGWVAGLAAILVFADTANATYLNSFYSDVPAVIGAIGAAWALQRRDPLSFAGFCFFALLLVASKGQHGIYAPLFAVIALVLSWRVPTLLRVTAAALLIAGGAYSWTAPYWYAAKMRFNVIFYGVARTARDPGQVLREMDLDDSYLQYVGMHAFEPRTPTENEAWMRDFARRTSYASIVHYYLKHPVMTLGLLKEALITETPQRRPANLGNFPRSSGERAGAKSYRFAAWSTLRSWLSEIWPSYILLLLAIMAARGAVIRDSVLVGICVTSVVEFGVASLADVLETQRHLLLFHILTDVAILQFVMSCVRLSSRSGRYTS